MHARMKRGHIMLYLGSSSISRCIHEMGDGLDNVSVETHTQIVINE